MPSSSAVGNEPMAAAEPTSRPPAGIAGDELEPLRRHELDTAKAKSSWRRPARQTKGQVAENREVEQRKRQKRLSPDEQEARRCGDEQGRALNTAEDGLALAASLIAITKRGQRGNARTVTASPRPRAVAKATFGATSSVPDKSRDHHRNIDKETPPPEMFEQQSPMIGPMAAPSRWNPIWR